MAKSTSGKESSAPRPAPVQPKPAPKPPIVHHGQQPGNRGQSPWGGKK